MKIAEISTLLKRETSFVYQDMRGFSLHEYSGIV